MGFWDDVAADMAAPLHIPSSTTNSGSGSDDGEGVDQPSSGRSGGSLHREDSAIRQRRVPGRHAGQASEGDTPQPTTQTHSVGHTSSTHGRANNDGSDDEHGETHDTHDAHDPEEMDEQALIEAWVRGNGMLLRYPFFPPYIVQIGYREAVWFVAFFALWSLCFAADGQLRFFMTSALAIGGVLLAIMNKVLPAESVDTHDYEAYYDDIERRFEGFHDLREGRLGEDGRVVIVEEEDTGGHAPAHFSAGVSAGIAASSSRHGGSVVLEPPTPVEGIPLVNMGGSGGGGRFGGEGGGGGLSSPDAESLRPPAWGYGSPSTSITGLSDDDDDLDSSGGGGLEDSSYDRVARGGGRGGADGGGGGGGAVSSSDGFDEAFDTPRSRQQRIESGPQATTTLGGGRPSAAGSGGRGGGRVGGVDGDPLSSPGVVLGLDVGGGVSQPPPPPTSRGKPPALTPISLGEPAGAYPAVVARPLVD